MKLECSVVKDLYVLYNENELSEEVRGAVEEHLEECEECKNIYNTGVNFQSTLQTDTITITQKLDEKILMKLKIARLKGLLLFTIIILIVISTSIYLQSRRYLSEDFSQYSSDIYRLRMQLESLKSPGEAAENSRYGYNYTIATLLNKLNKDYEPVYRDLNLLEKYSLKKLSVNQCFDLSLTNLILMLRNRMENGYWSDNDEQAYSMLKNEIDNLAVMSQNSSNGVNSKYYMLNTKEFFISFNKINELSKIYTKYNKLPEEISFLSQAELKNRIKRILNEDIRKIELRLSYNNTYDFTAYLKDSNSNYIGTIESYNGRITNFMSGGLETKGTLIDVEKAKETAKTMVLRNYGKDFDVKIEDLGINNNYQSDRAIKVYCFKVQPTYKGYEVFNQIIINIDGYTNKILEFSDTYFKGFTPLALSKDLKVDIKFTPESALKSIALENLNKDMFIFRSTYFIKSMFSGEYVLVHEYTDKGNNQPDAKKIHINATSGKIELPAYAEGSISY